MGWLTAYIAKLDQHEQWIDILHNIVEEHGDFNPSYYHSETFRRFLKSIGLDPSKVLEDTKASPAVDAFNTALMGVVYSKDPLASIACIGIIEYAFAEISAIIGNCVIDHGWIKREELVHYGVHAELDKTHAELLIAVNDVFSMQYSQKCPSRKWFAFREKCFLHYKNDNIFI